MNIYPDVKHFLFEPLEEYHDAIEENYKRIPHVLFGLAASNVDGHGELGFMSQSGSGIPTHSHVVGDDRAANWRKRQIKTVTLDSAMASQPAEKPYLLKIDVDGHE
jgi:FkbM family methyltransferase